MTVSTALVRQVQRVARELQKAATWRGSLLPVDASRDDFVYELVCYFRIALDTSSHFDLEISGNTSTHKGKKIALWPKKPGLKKSFSFISVQQKSLEIFQLVPGVKILDKYGANRAPDCNLLAGSTGSEPSWADLHALWDAKYTCRSAARLPDVAVSDFSYAFSALGKPVPPASWAMKVAAYFKSSGILTNATSSLEPDLALKANGILETSGFPDSPKTRP